MQAGKAISAEQDRVSKAIEAIGGESYEKYKDCWDDVIKEGEYPEDHCEDFDAEKENLDLENNDYFEDTNPYTVHPSLSQDTQKVTISG